MTDEELILVWHLQFRLAELTRENEELRAQVDRLCRANVKMAMEIADLRPKERMLA